MVSISHEPAVTTERRLVGVLQKSSVTHLGGTWSFVRCRVPMPDDAVAAVRDADGWCALVPADDGGAERFCLSSVVFPADVDNSGFVGWLAATIKQALGSGVFVICGDNPQRGGIFDYWGYPAGLAAEVRTLLDRLCVDDSTPNSLDLRVFRVTDAAPGSAISEETTFEFRERDGHVEANYRGGQIVAGHLLGQRNQDDTVDVAYTQLHSDGQLRTGTSSLRVEQLGSTGLRMIEEYEWTQGGRGQNVLESVEP